MEDVQIKIPVKTCEFIPEGGTERTCNLPARKGERYCQCHRGRMLWRMKRDRYLQEVPGEPEITVSIDAVLNAGLTEDGPWDGGSRDEQAA